jgi:hypothetical protein
MSFQKLVPVLRAAQSAANGLVTVLAVGALTYTLACALGLAQWPSIPLGYQEGTASDAGMWLQIGVTGLLCTVGLMLPANARMARLEQSHRSFVMGVEDVAHAYRLAHAADRAGVFALSGEFEAIRARLTHLREHPDLSHLEPELLQLAAQMSFTTRDLATTYSDEKVARARMFLRQRQEEAQAMADRLTLARTTVDELRRWLNDIEAEERQIERQIKRLEADLREVLPQLGYAMEADDPRESTVVQLPMPAK